jgi:hypothetical protein
MNRRLVPGQRRPDAGGPSPPNNTEADGEAWMQTAPRHRSIWLLVVGIVVVACGPADPDVPARAGAQRLERAVAGAYADRTYRVKGTVMFGGPLLSWEGIVDGDDEQYVLHAVGRIIDSRRIAGQNWWRPLGSSEPWKLAPADAPFDLGVLLRGEVVAARDEDDRWTLTLHFADVDVLAALTHVPSAGSTTAEVTIVNDRVAEVALRLSGFGNAQLSFWDYGTDVSIEPVTTT